MKQTEFLKYINIGKIIQAEMRKRNLIKDIETIAEKANLTKWIIKNTFRQEVIKINRLIKLSYATEIDFLQVYLQQMSPIGNTKYIEDEVIIEYNDVIHSERRLYS